MSSKEGLSAEVKAKIVAARTALIFDQPFFGTLALRLELVEDHGFPHRMGTDGHRLIYNPSLIKDWTVNEFAGVVAHEVLHCANGHIWRQGHRDHSKWNSACDYAINPILKEAGMTLPAPHLYDQQYEGMSAEEIYSKLPDDSSEEDKKAAGMGSCLKPESTGEGDSGGEGNSETEWKLATVQAAKVAQMQGKLPANLERLVKNFTKSRIDWKTVLRRFVQQTARADYTWQLPNARYMHMGMYLPSLRSESVPPIVVVIDTSGSIDAKTLSEFGAEVQDIINEVKPESTYLIYCDASINKVEEFEAGTPVEFKMVGGGGTDFRPPFAYVDKHEIDPACLIYLTDLYGPFPDPNKIPYPVLWVTKHDRETPPWGEHVSIY